MFKYADIPQRERQREREREIERETERQRDHSRDPGLTTLLSSFLEQPDLRGAAADLVRLDLLDCCGGEILGSS